MLKSMEELKGFANSIQNAASKIGADATEAIEDLKGFKSWAEKTRDSVTERGKALGEAIASDHAQMETEFAALMDKADALIKKLEGTNV